jgi:hypothetical protein
MAAVFVSLTLTVSRFFSLQVVTGGQKIMHIILRTTNVTLLRPAEDCLKRLPQYIGYPDMRVL